MSDADNFEKIAEIRRKIVAAAHGMQSGVAMMMHYNSAATEGKHLRVGVNVALVQQSALAELLMEKGVISPLEYWESQLAAMEREKAFYEQQLSNILGKKVTLA